jgi:hypothetical protein
MNEILVSKCRVFSIILLKPYLMNNPSHLIVRNSYATEIAKSALLTSANAIMQHRPAQA